MADNPFDKGVAIGQVTADLVGWMHDDPPEGRSSSGPKLDQLVERVSHLDGTKEQWRTAAAYLAAQLWRAQKTSDAARAQDTEFAMTMIADQVDWLRKANEERDQTLRQPSLLAKDVDKAIKAQEGRNA